MLRLITARPVPARTRTIVLSLAALSSLLCVSFLQTPKVSAQLVVGGDLSLALPMAIDDLGPGGSVGLRLGTELERRMILLAPELAFTATTFSKEGAQHHPPSVYRAVVGLRLGIGGRVRFGGMAHFGFGYVDWSRHWYEGRATYGYQNLSHTCSTYDAGVFLDVSPTWLTTVGLHAVYYRVSDDPKQIEPLDWLEIGLHATVLLL